MRLFRDAALDAYFFLTDDMKIDADGAPNAYHPDDTGLDALANAGYPDERWWREVLVPDPDDPSVAFVQPDGPFAGFFVSRTALQDPDRPFTDPGRYVDATKVPYLVLPGRFAGEPHTGRMGDFGFAINPRTGESTPFLLADVGPPAAGLGEVSIALAEGLGGSDVDPRTGSGRPEGRMFYVVFRFSSADRPADRWPIPPETMHRKVDSLVELAGGREALDRCIQARGSGPDGP